MDANHLSRRLQRLADWVQPGAVLLDIGSDHAYLPVYLAKHHRITRAIAGEITDGPYQRSVTEVLDEGFADIIDVRLGDGFEVLKSGDNVDTVVIAGMGGELITEILERALTKQLLPSQATLILQPNRKVPLVRDWLMANHYTVFDEGMVYDSGKYYEMIQAKPLNSGWVYTKDERWLGHFAAINDTETYRAYWHREYRKTKRILQKIDQSNHPSTGNAKRAYVEMIERHFSFEEEA